MEASVALQVLPWVGMDEVYPIVDSVIEYIKGTGVRYHVGPFETTMEGDLDVLLDIVKEAQHIAIAKGAPEVISMVKIAYRPDAAGSASIDSKISKYRDCDIKDDKE
ncbi:MAG: thiamine-binding protein [Saccharofermentanales bacterium]